MTSTQETSSFLRYLLPLAVALGALALWWALSAGGVFPPSIFPSPQEALLALIEETQSGRLPNDITASLWRVSLGYILAAVLGIPLGLWMGLLAPVRAALLPFVNFFRSLSPLAWIPFSILWFGIGDPPAIFLIFLACFFPLVLATTAAVANIPAIYFRVGRDYRFHALDLLLNVTFPAALPQIITALRVTAGVAWLVVVAAEMIARQNGLGALILDARDGLRPDLLVAGMIVIGTIGVLLDRILASLTRMPHVRWGYER